MTDVSMEYQQGLDLALQSLFSDADADQNDVRKLDAFLNRTWPQLYEERYGRDNFITKLIDVLRILRDLPKTVNLEENQEMVDLVSTCANKLQKQVISGAIEADKLKERTKAMYAILKDLVEGTQALLASQKLKVKMPYLNTLLLTEDKLRHYHREKYQYEPINEALNNHYGQLNRWERQLENFGYPAAVNVNNDLLSRYNDISERMQRLKQDQEERQNSNGEEQKGEVGDANNQKEDAEEIDEEGISLLYLNFFTHQSPIQARALIDDTINAAEDLLSTDIPVKPTPPEDSEQPVEFKIKEVLEPGKTHHQDRHQEATHPVISLSGSKALQFQENKQLANSDQQDSAEVTQGSGEQKQNESTAERFEAVQESDEKDFLMTQATEQSYRLDENGNKTGAVLSPDQVQQYYDILRYVVIQNKPVQQNKKSKKKKEAEKQTYADELLHVNIPAQPRFFWYAALTKTQQLEMYRRLKRMQEEAKEIAARTGQSHVRILLEMIGAYYGHRGNSGRVGPGMPHGQSNRRIIRMDRGDGQFETVEDSHAYLPEGQITTGIASRTASPTLAQLDFGGDPIIEAEHVKLVADNIEQDLHDRLHFSIQRYLYEIPNIAEHRDEIELAITRFIINLLSPGRYDGLMRQLKRILGKSYDNDNEQMTKLFVKACERLREKYRYKRIDVTIKVKDKITGEEQDQTYHVRPMFAVVTHGVNAIRASGALGWLQVDNNRDSTGTIAAIAQMAHETNLYANFIDYPQGTAWAQDSLFHISRQLQALMKSPDVKVIDYSKLRAIKEQIRGLKEGLDDVTPALPQMHTLYRMTMRLEAFHQHLKYTNRYYTPDGDHNLELMAAATLAIAQNPELYTYNCKSGNDRTGALNNMIDLLVLYHKKYDKFPPINADDWRIFYWAKQRVDSKYIRPELRPFFELYISVFIGGGHQARAREASTGETAIKSVWGAHSPAARREAKVESKALEKSGYAMIAVKMNKRVSAMSSFKFKNPEELYEARAWYVAWGDWILQHSGCYQEEEDLEQAQETARVIEAIEDFRSTYSSQARPSEVQEEVRQSMFPDDDAEVDAALAQMEGERMSTVQTAPPSAVPDWLPEELGAVRSNSDAANANGTSPTKSEGSGSGDGSSSGGSDPAGEQPLNRMSDSAEAPETAAPALELVELQRHLRTASRASDGAKRSSTRMSSVDVQIAGDTADILRQPQSGEANDAEMPMTEEERLAFRAKLDHHFTAVMDYYDLDLFSCGSMTWHLIAFLGVGLLAFGINAALLSARHSEYNTGSPFSNLSDGKDETEYRNNSYLYGLIAFAQSMIVYSLAKLQHVIKVMQTRKQYLEARKQLTGVIQQNPQAFPFVASALEDFIADNMRNYPIMPATLASMQKDLKTLLQKTVPTCTASLNLSCCSQSLAALSCCVNTLLDYSPLILLKPGIWFVKNFPFVLATLIQGYAAAMIPSVVGSVLLQNQDISNPYYLWPGVAGVTLAGLKTLQAWYKDNTFSVKQPLHHQMLSECKHTFNYYDFRNVTSENNRQGEVDVIASNPIVAAGSASNS